MSAKSNQTKAEPTTQSDEFTFNDQNLLRFEQSLSPWRDTEDDIWLLRDSVFGLLTGATGHEARLRFKLGFLSYLPQLLLSCWRTKRTRDAIPLPVAEFLVFIAGPISKEFDTLQSIAAELAKTHSTLVLWTGAEAPTAEAMELLRPAQVWHVRPEEPVVTSRFTVLADCFRVFKLMLRIALACRHIKGMGRAFGHRNAPLFDYLIQLRFWERFLTARLAGHQLRAVAFVSDVNPPGKILAKLARRRNWHSHHFLHGFPGLAHTRSIATDIHPFSQIERDYFLEQRWSPTQVHVLGHPRQCSLVRQIQRHRTLAPADGGLRVLFAGQHAFKGGFDAGQHHQTMQAVLEAATRLQLTPSEFRVRLHPGDDPSIYPRLADRYAPRLSKDAISNRSVAEDLAWANVVITVSSTMAIEACYAGCFLIWLALGDFRFNIREKLIAAGYGRLAISAAELYEVLQQCRDNDNRARSMEKMMKVGRELGILNPQVASDTAKCIVNENSPI